MTGMSMRLPSAFELDLDEDEREVVGVDHVVLDAGRARVALARGQLCVTLAFRLIQEQLPGRHRYDDIGIFVTMMAGGGARSESPLRDA